MGEGACGWQYSYSNDNMAWTDARQYCQKTATDLVAIQNVAENNYLNRVVPLNRNYYWIGIRKINNIWTWVANNKSLDEKVNLWATDEPTPGSQDCVEIYIKRPLDTGMWNNDPCTKTKRALCYKALCQNDSCSSHSECVEHIGNYSCKCNEGYERPRCDHAIKCKDLTYLKRLTISCSHPIAQFSFKSNCSFSCGEGFKLQGLDTLQCKGNGKWNGNIPTCKGVSCPNLKTLENGNRICLHPFGDFSLNSTCNFTCSEGFNLRGANSIRCTSSETWTAAVPTCEAVLCKPLLYEDQNVITACMHPNGKYNYSSTCEITCPVGYELQG
ncbi:P-selectin-like [Callorhinchus milii]|uniref:P-selectin-like n=1 Tax=Callorhinchus milii TaxID=7868 RepID=UPI001C3F6BDA|nr:P-selectin-like [Callorhinchus milii]